MKKIGFISLLLLLLTLIIQIVLAVQLRKATIEKVGKVSTFVLEEMIGYFLDEEYLEPGKSFVCGLDADGTTFRWKGDSATISSKGEFQAMLREAVYDHLIQNEMDPVFSVTFSFTVLVLSNIFVVYVLQSNEFAIKNMIIDLKDKVIAFINFVIITMLLFIIYIPFLQKIVGTTPLTLKELLCAVLISIIVTLPFDLLK